jgi:pimeloyl-ACP methyl ester carboxylesterase
MTSSRAARLLQLEIDRFRFEGLSDGLPEKELILFLHGFPDFADAWLPVLRSVAAKGYYAVAVNQRGYSRDARPNRVEDYATDALVGDALGFADCLGADQFHLVAHDWGGLLAWQIATEHASRLRSLSVVSTPHTNAFLDAIETDADQKQRSKYIEFFRIPGAAESYFQAEDWKPLRRVYQGKVAEERVEANIRRLSEPGALTAALNWYRALNLKTRIGMISVPTLFMWGSNDLTIGQVAADNTASYVTGPYRFETLGGKSHWLLDETPGEITKLLLEHFASVRTACTLYSE